MALFSTPIERKIESIVQDLRSKIDRITCKELLAKGVVAYKDEILATIDNKFPTLNSDLSYSDGGNSGGYLIVLAKVSFNGNSDFFEIRPQRHLSRLPHASIGRSENKILFSIAVSSNDAEPTLAIKAEASKELQFTNWYLSLLKEEWDTWYNYFNQEIYNALNEKFSSCKERISLIDTLNS